MDKGWSSIFVEFHKKTAASARPFARWQPWETLAVPYRGTRNTDFSVTRAAPCTVCTSKCTACEPSLALP